MEQLYTFRYASDYRSSASIYYEKVEADWYEKLTSQGWEEDDLRFEAKLKHPKTGYKVLLGCEFDCYKFLKEWKFITKENAEKHINKAFSQFHGFLPYVVTGHTSAYKEMGYYPDIPQYIEDMDTIELNIPEYTDNIYFLVLMDKSKIIFTLSLTLSLIHI